jgi:hypothetical protein
VCQPFPQCARGIRGLVLAIAVVLAVEAPAIAANLLFVENELGALADPGRRLRLDDADFDFTAMVWFGEITVELKPRSGDPFGGWTLRFAPRQGGGELALGEYQNVRSYRDPNRPSMSVQGDSADCNFDGGRFVVRAVEIGDDSEVEVFVADFEQLGGEKRYGAIRYHSGDAACALATDGTPCDPLDDCAGTAACHEGVCVAGQDRVTCSGQAEACHTPPVCDPRLGTCLSPGVVPDRSSCDDGNACTINDRCIAGVCEPSPSEFERLDCYDGGHCTDDGCDPDLGCRHAAVPGTCGSPGAAATLLYMTGNSSRGTERLFTPADTDFELHREEEAVTIVANERDDLDGVSITIGPRAGQRLVPGVYEPTRGPDGPPSQPLLDVSGCGIDGRFEVLEVGRGGSTRSSVWPCASRRCASRA